MSKKLFFTAILLFLMSGFLFSQSDTVTVPSNAIFSQSFPPRHYPPIFFSMNKDIPEKVLRTKEESLVAVRVSFPVVGKDTHLYEDDRYGAGFCVWGNYVATSLHIFGQHPALWFGTEEFPTIPAVFDGQNFFSAQLVFYSSQADLALLKIATPNSLGQNFAKKPARLFKMALADHDSLEHLARYGHFYAFGPYTGNPDLFFALELGPFRAITNSFDEGYILPIPMGILQGSVQLGFSGGPLLTPKGEVAGMVASTSAINTFVVTTETISEFLMMARNSLGLDINGRPLAKPNQVQSPVQ